MKWIGFRSWSWRGHQLLLGVILLMYLLLLAWGAWVTSPTVDEVAHLPAGLSHWQLGRFDLYRVNPPLVRMIAALPVLAAQPNCCWTSYDPAPNQRSEFRVGTLFMQLNGSQARWLFAMGRWACLVFAFLGAVLVWRWAQELFGGQAGLLALLL
jgi:TRAP-type C4-dicarboxylate transport system permease small subunit